MPRLTDPTDLPTVEKRHPESDTPFFCTFCSCSFDRESFEMEENCPGCQAMEEQQRKMNQRGIRGGL